MPPEVEEKVKAPEKAEFQSGLISNESLNDTLNVDANKNLITKGRSFMDKGEEAYSSDEKLQRDETARGARATLLVRMKRENQQSQADAVDMQNQHTRHKENVMDPAIRRARAKIMEAYSAKADYYTALAISGPEGAAEATTGIIALKAGVPASEALLTQKMNNAERTINQYRNNPRSAILRAVSFASVTKKRKRQSFIEASNSAVSAASQIKVVSDSWDDYMKQYREGTYKVRYKNYDRLFQSYYMLSRGENLTDAGKENFKRSNDDNANAENTNAKDIVEYTGRYSNPGAWPNKVQASPFADDVSEIVGKNINDGSRNYMDGNFKHHTMVAMEGFGTNADGSQVKTLSEEQAGEQPVRRVRFKIDNRFTGYKAKNQMNDQGRLVEDAGFAGSDDAQKRGMSEMGLIADERGTNGEFLFSQKSAKIYNAKSKNNSQRTNGFYIGGEFISANKNVMTDQEEASYWKSPNFAKVAKDERLRTAIRRSDYFRHINKATIQLYMNYNDQDATISDQNVTGDFMAKRSGFFSMTKLGQSLLDGSLLGTLGGLAGTAISGAKEWGDIPDDKINKLYVKYGEVAAKSANTKSKFFKTKDKGITFGALGLGATAIMPVAAIFGAAEAGAKASLLVHTLISMVRNISSIVRDWGDMRKRNKGESIIPFIVSIGESCMDFIDSAATFTEYIMSKTASDTVKGIIGGVKDAILAVKSVVEIIVAGVEKSQITKSDKRLETLMNTLKGINLNASAEDTAEADSLKKNTQAKNFLKLARFRASRDQANSAFTGVSKGLNSFASFAGMGDKKSWINPLSLPFKLASKVVSFIGIIVNKGIGAFGRANNVEMMLGERDLDKTPHFSDILKEETGINNRHYISDLVRVFTAIDTHCLLHKSAANNDLAGFALAKDVIAPYYKIKENESGEDFAQRVSLARFMKALGAPKNWRSVLMESIS